MVISFSAPKWATLPMAILVKEDMIFQLYKPWFQDYVYFFSQVFETRIQAMISCSLVWSWPCPVADVAVIQDITRFLQIGQWRLGALNDDTFVVEHSTGHTVQTYYSPSAFGDSVIDDPVVGAEKALYFPLGYAWMASNYQKARSYWPFFWPITLAMDQRWRRSKDVGNISNRRSTLINTMFCQEIP